MGSALFSLYENIVIKRPVIPLIVVLMITAFLGTKIPQLRLDASADSLVLEGDQALAYFRETSQRYAAEDFLLISFTPKAELFSAESLAKLSALKQELSQLDRVSSVVSILDVPLLASPPVTVGQVAGGDLKTLSSPGVDFELAKKEFSSSPLYKTLLTSEDNKTTAIQVNLKRNEHYFTLLAGRDAARLAYAEQKTDANKLAKATAERVFTQYADQSNEDRATLIAATRAILARYRGEDTLFLGGVPMIAADMVSFIAADIQTFGLALLVFMVVMLSIIFRGLRWVLIPLITCAGVIITMSGLLAWIQWPLTVISSNFIALLLILTLSVCIHLVVRYRELLALDSDMSQQQLLSGATRLMLKPCVYTTLTTIVAFASLVVSGIRPVVNFGWMLTMGVTIAFLYGFIVLPALLSLLSKRESDGEHGGVTFTRVFANLAERHATSVAVAAVLVSVLSAVGISRLEVENRFIDYFKKDTEIYQGMELIDENLGGTIPLEIIIDVLPEDEEEYVAVEGEVSKESDDEESDFFDDDFEEDFEDDFSDDASASRSSWFSSSGMRSIESVHDYLDSLPETGKVLSLATLYKLIEQISGDEVDDIALALVQRKLPDDVSKTLVSPFLDDELDQARITVRVKETSRTLRRNELLQEIQNHLVNELNFDPSQVHLTGMLVMYNNMLQSLYRSQILTLGTVFLCIIIMFLILFRSLWLALVAIIPNILAAAVILGGMGLAGIPLDIMTVTIAAITVGIGVDDTIHYVHRFQEEFAKDRDYLAAMHRSHASIGKAMYYTSITIIIGFSVLALSNFIPSIYFGLLTGCAMLVALVSSLLLLPLMIVYFKPLGR